MSDAPSEAGAMKRFLLGTALLTAAAVGAQLVLNRFAPPTQEGPKRTATKRRRGGAGSPVRFTSPLPEEQAPVGEDRPPRPTQAAAASSQNELSSLHQSPIDAQTQQDTRRALTPSDIQQVGSQEVFQAHLDSYQMSRQSGVSAEHDLAEESLENDAAVRARLSMHRRGRRSTVCGPSTNVAESMSYEVAHEPKPAGHRDILLDVLNRCHLFAHLDEEELELVVSAMSTESFTKGTIMAREDQLVEPEFHKFYILVSGEISVMQRNVVVRLLEPGAFFGEQAIMFVHPKSHHTFRVDSDISELYSLNSEAYRHILTRVAVNKRELYEGFLDRVSWLKGLTHVEKVQLADCLQPVVYNQGDYLIEYNTIGDWFFIILEGSVDVYGRDNGEVMYVCSFGVGDCVGELEFINHHRTVADVRARGRVKAARLHREHFEMCMGAIVDVLRRTAVVDDRYSYYNNRMRQMRRVNEEITP